MKTVKRKYFIPLFFLLLLPEINIAKANTNFYTSVKKLSLFLASNEYLLTKTKMSEAERMDLILKKSLEFTGSISEALLVATFSTIPFKYFPFVTPVFKLHFKIPMPVGPLKIFDKKIDNLPSRLFFDSPHSKHGDVDKLGHFFANAFLVYNFNCYEISNFMGILIELFEKNFKVNGFVDTRDLRINALGAMFGKALRRNKQIKPSEFLKVYNLLFFKINLF